MAHAAIGRRMARHTIQKTQRKYGFQDADVIFRRNPQESTTLRFNERNKLKSTRHISFLRSFKGGHYPRVSTFEPMV